MLKKISITIELACPNCETEAKHSHDFELNSSMQGYTNGQLTAIGHTKRIYESVLNFNCPKCKCWHSAVMEPIEVHVHSEETEAASTCTIEEMYGADDEEELDEEDHFQQVNLKDSNLLWKMPKNVSDDHLDLNVFWGFLA